MKKEDFVSAHSTKVEIGTAKMRNNKPFAVKIWIFYLRLFSLQRQTANNTTGKVNG